MQQAPVAPAAPQLLVLTPEQFNGILNQINLGQQAPAAAPVARRHTIAKVAPPSNYAGSPATLDGWLHELQQQFSWYQFASEVDRVALASAHLRAAALDWWCTLPGAELSLSPSLSLFAHTGCRRASHVD
jgi:hypothetical protein